MHPWPSCNGRTRNAWVWVWVWVWLHLEVERSKVKITKPLDAVTENQPYLRNGRPTNFKLGIRMEYEDLHWHRRWSVKLKVTVQVTTCRRRGNIVSAAQLVVIFALRNAFCSQFKGCFYNRLSPSSTDDGEKCLQWTLIMEKRTVYSVLAA